MSNGLPQWLNRTLAKNRRMHLPPTYIEVLEQRQMLSTVMGRQLFYNNSAFDGNQTAANAKDDLAIAVDKVALTA